ncbi:MAG: hypothetical protein C0427_10335 [Rhodobacter sp.]|nr:hypothetical protein [Rhodobacter sp.]
MLCNSPRAIGPAETTIRRARFRHWSMVQIFSATQPPAMLWQASLQRMSRVLTMFRYLVFFGVTFYLVLLIGGEDRGQQRMGLQGAYDVALAPALPAPETEAEAQPETQTAAATTAPSDTLRILPAPDRATIQPASLTSTTAEPAFNDFNNPTVILRYITADAANVRDAASRSGSVIDRVERGEIVQVVEEVGDWVHIRIEGDGLDGFVHRRLISSEAPSLSTLSLGPSGD